MRFVTTRWSVIVAAGEGEGPALDALCRIYWYPLYAFARRCGKGVEEAQDSVQGFLAHLLEKEALEAADPERGRFRTFLLAAYRNFAINEARAAAALKRGGGQATLSLEAMGPEARFRLEPGHDATPERLFDRDWALSILREVLETVRRSYEERGRGELFEQLKPLLAGRDTGPSLAERAAALEMSGGALKVAAHRLRRRYRETLRAHVAQTLADGENLEEELRALFRALEPV